MLRKRKRVVASLLAAVLLIGQLGATVYAEGPPDATEGLCEHHTAHDDTCGYVKAIPGHDCKHEHGPECYTDELICGLDEDAEQTASSSDAGHTHGQECHALDCPHERGEHDGACGYAEATPGTPCGYVCDLCGREPDKDSGTISVNNPPAPGTGEPEAATVTVTAFDELGDDVKVQSLPLGAPESNVNFPTTLGASGYIVADDTDPVPEPITITGVMWELTGENNSPTTYEDGREKPCNYYFQPVLPEGYELAGDAALPKIEVRYGWATRANTGGSYNTDDVAAFQAILTAHPALKNITGVGENDPASWETAGLIRWDTSSPKRLYYLSLYDKGLTGTLDVGNLTSLTYLHCYNNKLDKLDMGNLTSLTSLYCDNNNLDKLDVGNLTSLTSLSCYNNNLDKLDVGNLTSLTSLYCYNNKLDNLDVGNLTSLTSLSCGSNNLDKLDVGNLMSLTALYCGSNNLDKLDVGNLMSLTDLSCNNNNLDKLDVGNLTSLTSLYCDNNNLDKLDVGNLISLTSLSCGSNNLDKLDVGNLMSLTALYCGSNNLDKLDVGNLMSLTDLSCNNNNLDKLDVGNLTSLTSLYCDNNPFTSFTTKDGHTLTVTPAANGKIWLMGFDMSNNRVNLTAKPDSGYTFQVWSGLPAGVPGDQTTSFTLNSNITVAAAFRPIGADATLKSLSLSGVTLTPAFDPATTSYTATVGNAMDKVTVTVEANDPKARVMLLGDWIATLPESILRLNVGENTLTALVKAEDGITEKDYTVIITREAAAGAATVTIDTIPGVTAPVKGATPVTAITETAQYTGTVTWNPAPGAAFAPNTEYTATITLTPKAGYTLQGVAADFFKMEGATATNNADSGTVTAIFPKTAPDGGNSDNDGDNNEPTRYTITTPQPPKPDNPVLAVIELPVTVGDGTATGKPDDGRTAAAIAETGNKAGAKQNGIAVQYDAKTSTAYDGFSITIKRATLDQLTADKNKVKWLTLNTGIVDLTFDLAALKEIAANSTGDITLTATRETGLTGDALAAVGTRPAYRLAVGYTGKDGKAATVQDFGAGRVTVGLAYAPAATEQAGSLCLVYSKDGKDAEWLYSSYDRTSGNVIASVGHFSIYAVGHRPAPAFTDTVNHWAKADIDFVASRGLLTGTGETTFSPDSTITRGMFVTALGRLAGVDPAAYPSSGWFTDVAATAYYAPFVEWAASKGIVNGSGEKSFSPDAAITREQMAAIMQRYADKLGYTLPVAREAEIFVDEGQITNGMKNAVQAIQQAGIMNGKGGHRFGPKDTATRAEAAAVLRRFAEVVIDRATAGGWGQNDAGRWLYYEDAKPVTGWKQIDSKWYYFDTAGLMQAGGWREIGGKWYYFYPDGAMAVNTKIDGYEIGPDGARIES